MTMRMHKMRVHPHYPAFLLALGVAFITVSVLGFLKAEGPANEGAPVHQWLGLALVGGMATHCLARWKWLLRPPGRLEHRKARVDYAIDWILVLLVLALVVSGLMLGGQMGNDLARSQPWQGMHHLASKLMILLATWHIIRHRRWIRTKIRAPIPRSRVSSPHG